MDHRVTNRRDGGQGRAGQGRAGQGAQGKYLPCMRPGMATSLGRDTAAHSLQPSPACLQAVWLTPLRAPTHRAGMVTSLGRVLSCRRRMRIRYCVILVSRCLFLCTRNLGQ